MLRRSSAEKLSPEAMTLSQHLGELRRRLVISVAVFVVCAIVAYVLYPQILTFLKHPYCATFPKSCSLYVTGPLDGFGIRLDVTGYGGALLASPIIIFQLWRFVTPGLKANEKKYALPFSFATAGLFLLGAFVAWLTFPHALGFLHSVGGPGIVDIFSPSRYLTLILALMAIFGLTFEFPLILMGLELAHVISSAQLRKWRRIAIVSIVIVSAVITPSSDPFSMLAMALPMLVFYELSIIGGKLLGR
jgi:sec-independent protein translocase protein TatC